MGHNYLPKYYLKGFCRSEDNSIWAFDKTSGNKFITQIKTLANITGLYSEEIEQYLANEIENPANPVLDKLRNHQTINDSEKSVFAKYISVMWKRVPRAQEDVKKMAPRIADEIGNKLKFDLMDKQVKMPEETNFIDIRRREIDDIISRFSECPPKDIWLKNIPPDRTPNIVNAIKSMTWRFFEFDDNPAFLTCDNPVFYFQEIGVGRKDSELSFPISSHIVLWATWRSDISDKYIKASSQVVKEMNRRTAHNASKFVFHSKDEYWIGPFLKKGR